MWGIRSREQNNKNIPARSPYGFLSGHRFTDLFEFVEETLKVIGGLSFCKIILTVTDNNATKARKNSILEWHIQDLLQRVEMELRQGKGNKDAVAVFFLDALEPKCEKLLRNKYVEVVQKGDFVKKYSHVKDSMSFEFSHHSVGIQLADYVAGICNDALKGRKRSEHLFSTYVKPKLRKKDDGETIAGYGLMEIPTAETVRSKIVALLGV